MTRAPSPLARSITRFYRGWHSHVRASSRENAFDIMIADLPNDHAQPFRLHGSRDILGRCERLLEQAETHRDQLGPFEQYSISKLGQSLAMVRQNQSASITRADIVRRGTKWQSITNNDIARLRSAFSQATDEAKSSVVKPDELDRYFNESVPAIDVGPLILTRAQHWLRYVRRIHPALTPFELEYEYLPSPAGWRNLVTYVRPKFHLVINNATHHSYSRALIDCFALHEICGHMVHLAHLEANRQLQETSPHLLCIAIHTQDAYLTEGIAQIMAALLVYRFAPTNYMARAAFRQFELFFAIRHRNVMDLIDGTIDTKKAGERHIKTLGGHLREVIALYDRLLIDPLFCCQVLNYHAAYTTLLPLLDAPELTLQPFIGTLLSGFYAAADIDEMITTLD